MNEIKKTTLHPDNQPNTDLYPKTSTDQVEGLQEFVEQYSSDSVKVPINVPKGATNGNITDEQLTILQKSDLNYIEMVNDKELYYLNDPGHEEGFLTYSHVGIENSKATIKTLTITVSAKSFVIVTTVVPTESGGKLYLHNITLSTSKSSALGKFCGTLFSNSNEALTISTIQSLLDRYYGSQMITSKDFISSGSTTIGIYRNDKLYELTGVDFEGNQTLQSVIDIDTLSDTVTEL